MERIKNLSRQFRSAFFSSPVTVVATAAVTTLVVAGVALFALQAAPHLVSALVSAVHTVTSATQPHIACGNGEGGCPSIPIS